MHVPWLQHAWARLGPERRTRREDTRESCYYFTYIAVPVERGRDMQRITSVLSINVPVSSGRNKGGVWWYVVVVVVLFGLDWFDLILI